MLRKWLFLGLTLALMAAVVNFIIQGRKLEKEQAKKPVEVVQNARSTPTRVLSPPDLKIVQSSMRLEGEKDSSRSASARHEIGILNAGNVPYREIKLRFSYFDRVGKLLTAKTQTAVSAFLPGTSTRLTDILISDIPDSAFTCRVNILYADLGDRLQNSR